MNNSKKQLCDSELEESKLEVAEIEDGSKIMARAYSRKKFPMLETDTPPGSNSKNVQIRYTGKEDNT